MMTRIFHNNLVDRAANVTVPVGGQAAGLPAANLQDSQLTKVARLTGRQVEFDFGTKEDVQAIILANHTLTVPVKVEVHVDGEESDWVTVATMQTGSTVAYAQCNPVKAQKVRLSFEQDSVDIGRVYLGSYAVLRRGLAPDGFSYEETDESESQTSIGGQEYTAIQPQRRILSLRWNALTEAELLIFKSLFATHGKHTPFFVWVKELLPVPAYVKLDGNFAPEMVADVRPRLWDLDLTLRGQL